MNQKNNILRKGTALLFTTILVATVFAGCGQNENPSPGASGLITSSSPAEFFQLSIMAPLYSSQPPVTDDSNPAFKALQELTNTKLQVTFVPSATYNDKVNVSIASGTVPQAMVVLENKHPSIINAVRSGAFWEVGPYIEEFPNLSKYWNDTIAANMAVDGKIYGIYRARPFVRFGVVYRKDWLENVGLQPPETIDDLYNMAKAFTLNDPNKSGKNDTYGLNMIGSVNDTMRIIQTSMGGYNQWGIQDGKITNEVMTKEHMETLKLFRKMYEEKLINQDFAALKGIKLYEGFNQGKAGMYFAVIDDGANKHDDLYKLNPNAKVDVAMAFNGPAGPKSNALPGFAGVFMFPKSSVKTVEELKQVLAYFDKALDPEVIKLGAFGVEGMHYKTENGQPLFTDQNLYAEQVDQLTQLKVAPVDTGLPAENPLMATVRKLWKENEKNGISNAAQPFVSQTEAEIGAELEKLLSDARVKFIMGELDEAGYAKSIAEWREKGGDKISEEYTEEYQKTLRMRK
ncbi:extracellular solute-binding protein [Paenibacillus sp. J2TS4]|uniref:extracellular solute-binding protein n=1 Tax=Paenibacillus sp. J2TS4 TaxID=2807194 RepID=UPI001B18F1C3|nr:extracellular solute-binding protein [Paenibacillus sp. J2TS4]GIP31230.1 putative ABC transporter peptide-binding protein YtcQ [Paenibacillus sp. J2TS4]